MASSMEVDGVPGEQDQAPDSATEAQAPAPEEPRQPDVRSALRAMWEMATVVDFFRVSRSPDPPEPAIRPAEKAL